jgi:hypothetical protein
MDISAVVIVLILIVLFFGGVVWMELHARKTGREAPIGDKDRSRSNQTDLDQYSRFFQLKADRTASIKTGSEERNHE